MPKRIWIPGACALAALAGAAVVAAHPDHDPPRGAAGRELEVVVDGAELGGRLELDDLEELAPGESRSYTTEGGKIVVVTRDDDGYKLDVDGREIRLGALDGAPLPGARVVRRERVEIDGDARGKVWISRAGEGPGGHDVLVLRDLEGPDGFAFATGDGELDLPLPLGVDELLARLAKNEKFAGLDELTQELVREAIRESAPKLPRLGRLEGADGGGLRIVVRERVRAPEEE